jgi:hypothetical protein
LADRPPRLSALPRLATPDRGSHRRADPRETPG